MLWCKDVGVSQDGQELPRASDELRQEVAQLQQQNLQLRQENEHLRQAFREQQATIAQLQSAIEVLSEQNTLLKKSLFGQRRERYLPSADQKLLFLHHIRSQTTTIEEMRSGKS